MAKENIISFSDLIIQIEKNNSPEEFLPGDGVPVRGELEPLDISRDHLLGLFAEFYKTHASKAIKKAQGKVKNKVTTPLSEKKEKFLVEVLKNNKSILSIAAGRNVSLEKLAQDMRRQLEDFSRLNDQLNLLVS